MRVLVTGVEPMTFRLLVRMLIGRSLIRLLMGDFGFLLPSMPVSLTEKKKIHQSFIHQALNTTSHFFKQP